jgi:AcrR family transcriptional regulator
VARTSRHFACKNALITGGSGGVGLANAHCFVDTGAGVTRVARRADPLQSASRRIVTRQASCAASRGGCAGCQRLRESCAFRFESLHNGCSLALGAVEVRSDRLVSAAVVGRPRDRQIDVAVLDAAIAVLGRVGYGGLTFEAVAREAGTTKPAIYRRWPSRQRLVLAALDRRVGAARAPDTGCTLCDLDECLKVFVAVFRRIPPGVMGPLFADCAGARELRAMFMTTLFDPPRAAVRTTLERALQRGDLRDELDVELILDLLGSLIHYRALFGHAPTSDAEIERTVEALLQGIATDYEALVEHSRRVSGDPKLHQLHT